MIVDILKRADLLVQARTFIEEKYAWEDVKAKRYELNEIPWGNICSVCAEELLEDMGGLKNVKPRSDHLPYPLHHQEYRD